MYSWNDTFVMVYRTVITATPLYILKLRVVLIPLPHKSLKQILDTLSDLQNFWYQYNRSVPIEVHRVTDITRSVLRNVLRVLRNVNTLMTWKREKWLHHIADILLNLEDSRCNTRSWKACNTNIKEKKFSWSGICLPKNT